jgi:DNA-binding MarR family transcriptional regulator
VPHLLLKDLPRYECLLEAAKEFPDLDPSASEAFLHLLRSGDESARVVQGHLARHNISQGRFAVLMILLRRCGFDGSTLGPAELADAAGVSRATMTGLIDTLERDGLVTREPDTQDRRMMIVCLTPKGHELLHAILPGHFKRMAWLMSPLSEQERQTLVQLLGKIQRQANAFSEADPAAVTLSVG